MYSANPHSKRYILGSVTILIVAIVAVTKISVQLLREREIESWKNQLANLSLVLAEQTSQTITSSQIALDNIADRVHTLSIHNENQLRVQAGSSMFFQLLRDTISGLPQVDVAGIVAANGDAINFTRSFPAPKINVSDRNYFKAQRDNPSLGLLISMPLQNRIDGKWVFYLSRRLNDDAGKFMGLVLVGISVDQFTDFYERLGKNLGAGASVTLYRNDFSMLARWPREDGVLGEKNLAGITHQVVEGLRKNSAVIYTDGHSGATDDAATAHLGAVRVLSKFPLIVNLTISEDYFLENWRRAAKSITLLAAGSIVSLLIGAYFLSRLNRRQKHAAMLLKNLSDEVPGMLFQLKLNPDGSSYFTYANKVFLDLYGLKAEQIPIEGQKIFAFQHPDDQEMLRASIQESAQNLTPWHLDYRLQFPDKGVVWRHGDAQPQRLPDGSILWHGYIANITERKIAEQTLQKMEARFRNILERAPIGMLINDLEGHLLYANQAFCDMLGYQNDELKKLTFFDLTHPEDIELSLPSRQQLLEGKIDSYQLEKRYLHKNGKTVWARLTSTLELNSEHASPRFIAQVEDITEHKRVEAELRIAATAFESHEGMMITDAHSRILKVNRAFTSITGYSEEEVIGKNPRFLQSGHQDEKFYAAMWNSIRQNGSWEGEVWNLRKNGEIYPEHLSITAVKDATDTVTHYVGALNDSTQRQQMLEKLRGTASKLERANLQIEEERQRLFERVEERTAQLRAANKAKDSFLATMSHEIRTPLGGLMGMMELLDISQLDHSQRELLRTARESANNLLRIVNDILDWSKIEAGKLAIVPRPASIAEMFKNVNDTYAHTAISKGITLVCHADEKLCAMHSFDPLRVSQILNNLASNAIKFTDHGKVEVHAEHVALANDAETIRFSVKDSGIGISLEHQARIFLQYEQASVDTARMYGGTGLGLAICHRLTNLMGCTLKVESTPGVGSTFNFTLTLPIADAAQQERPSHARQPTNNLVMNNQNSTILIVDDHPVNRLLLKQQLAQLDLKVEAAESGAPALSLWQNKHYDLIITDCHMPEVDGYELTRRIREIEQQTGAQRIPIIAWTANVLTEEVSRCQAAGMDDMLTKPTELNHLREMLLKWLIKVNDLPNA